MHFLFAHSLYIDIVISQQNVNSMNTTRTYRYFLFEKIVAEKSYSFKITKTTLRVKSKDRLILFFGQLLIRMLIIIIIINAKPNSQLKKPEYVSIYQKLLTERQFIFHTENDRNYYIHRKTINFA